MIYVSAQVMPASVLAKLKQHITKTKMTTKTKMSA